MKTIRWCLVLLLVGILLFVGGCDSFVGRSWEDLQERIDALEARVATLESIPTPPVIPVEPTGYSDINIPISQFQLQPHIDVAMSTVLGGELTITLGSNPTTGYQWSEEAEISDENIIKQISHGFVAPGIDEPPGTPGEEVWVFKGLERGTTTILLEYSRSWTGAGLWAVIITATIR